MVRSKVRKRAKSMILRTVKHGKNRAIVFSDEILLSAGIDKTDSIELTVDPKGDLFLQAAEPQETPSALNTFKKVKRKYSKLFRNLADR